MKKTPRIAAPRASRYLASGPLVWVATMTCTTLLLLALKQALWLVVPFLLAIILYYALFPTVRYVALKGVDRETAAAIVSGLSLLLVSLALVPTLPWLAAQAVSGQEALFRYLAGGRLLVERSLLMLESQFGFLKDLGLSRRDEPPDAGLRGSYVKEHLADVLLATAAWLPAMLLAPFLAFFFLRDGRRFPQVPGRSRAERVLRADPVHDRSRRRTARAYFQGLLKLTMIDTFCLALGLAAIGMPSAFALGLMAAVLAWVPFVGSVIGCVIVVLVAATDFPESPWVVYAAIGLFLFVRLLDDFVFMPLTVGRSLHMHPLPTVLLIFLGGAVAGIPGLILVLPLAGVVMVVAGTIGGIVNDPRLGARHTFAKKLRGQRITADLQP
jgi:predicted PurR-regulated permease PerM